MWNALVFFINVLSLQQPSVSFDPSVFTDFKEKDLRVFFSETSPIHLVESASDAPGELASDETVELENTVPRTPLALDLEAMAMLDEQASALRDLAGLEAETPLSGPSTSGPSSSSDFTTPKPFNCDLPLLSALLTMSVEQASDDTITRWGILLDKHAISNLPRDTTEENCAVNQAILSLLDRAAAHGNTICRPIENALTLARIITQIPPGQQPQYARELSLLAQKQSEYRVQGRPPTDLCPEYKDLETKLLSAIN